MHQFAASSAFYQGHLGKFGLRIRQRLSIEAVALSGTEAAIELNYRRQVGVAFAQVRVARRVTTSGAHLRLQLAQSLSHLFKARDECLVQLVGHCLQDADREGCHGHRTTRARTSSTCGGSSEERRLATATSI